MNMEQIKVLTQIRDFAINQLQTMEEAESEMQAEIVKLEERLEHTKKMNLGLNVSGTSVEVFLQNQIDFEKSNLDNFRTYKQPREKMYKDQVASTDNLLKKLLNQ